MVWRTAFRTNGAGARDEAPPNLAHSDRAEDSAGLLGDENEARLKDP